MIFFFVLSTYWLFFSTGTKVEGILRQSADVEEVDRRVQEYEQGIWSTFIQSFTVLSWVGKHYRYHSSFLFIKKKKNSIFFGFITYIKKFIWIYYFLLSLCDLVVRKSHRLSLFQFCWVYVTEIIPFSNFLIVFRQDWIWSWWGCSCCWRLC